MNNFEDSSDQVKLFFDKFYQQQMAFPSNQVDAVMGFFQSRGFDEAATRSTSIILLNQAKIEGISVFALIDTLNGADDVKLSEIVTEILNSARHKSSTLGFRVINSDPTFEARNILS